MIFDKNYDKSLWLILMNDKDNREEIIKFIKNIPKELYVKLNAALKKYYEFESSAKGDSISDFILCGEVVDSNQDIYSFYINPKDGVLNLAKHVLNKFQYYYCSVELFLVPYGLDENLEIFNKQLIGKIWCATDERKFIETYSVADYDYIKYEFINMFCGNALIVCSSNTKKRIRKINRREMKDDYNLRDLESFKF